MNAGEGGVELPNLAQEGECCAAGGSCYPECRCSGARDAPLSGKLASCELLERWLVLYNTTSAEALQWPNCSVKDGGERDSRCSGARNALRI